MATPFDQDVNSSVEGTEQAPRQLGGFDCEFVERPPEAFQVDCPICLSVLREPHQVTCCGYSYCQSCIERVQLQKSSCPTCNGTDFSVFPNKGLKRSLCAFKVRCSHKKEGCQWTGDLGKLDKHLNVNPKLHEQLTGCEFAKIECHYCSKVYQRRYITAHQTEKCVRRPFNCHFCGTYRANFEDVTTKHWPVCGFYPVSCPNKCGVQPKRLYLERHVSKGCPLTVVNCDFHYAGCNVHLPRKDMPTHLAENVVEHMSLMAVQDGKKDKEITKLKDTLAQTEMRFAKEDEEIEKLKAKLAESRNREIRLGKHLEENAQLAATHMSIMDKQNEMRFTKEDEEITRLKDELAERMREIVKLEEVHERKIEALERESKELRRRLAQQTREVEHKLEPVLPSLPVEFAMTNFEEHKQNKQSCNSPPFYTHPRGYKMCLRVNANGPTRACFTVGARLMRGDFDHLLKWPFEHSIAFEIVNQLQDSGHYRLTAAFFGSRRACRVTDGEMSEKGEGGCVPYDKLNHDPANHCQYLKNNSLRIRVSHVVNRDVLQLQRQCIAIESHVCLCPIEFTMTDFKRFKQEHDRWLSPSFYTHKRGYRICVEVSACDSEHNTHIAVYVHLMQGKYDNSLKWPFYGDITIHLLNQQQNKGHCGKTINFNDKRSDDVTDRVTACVMNKGCGYPGFISYVELAYNQATNIQYLYNDCLRFRVTAKVK